MQQGNFIDLFLARHVSGTYAHHQEHWMLSCSIWFSAPSFWMGGGRFINFRIYLNRGKASHMVNKRNVERNVSRRIETFLTHILGAKSVCCGDDLKHCLPPFANGDMKT